MREVELDPVYTKPCTVITDQRVSGGVLYRFRVVDPEKGGSSPLVCRVTYSVVIGEGWILVRLWEDPVVRMVNIPL